MLKFSNLRQIRFELLMKYALNPGLSLVSNPLHPHTHHPILSSGLITQHNSSSLPHKFISSVLPTFVWPFDTNRNLVNVCSFFLAFFFSLKLLSILRNANFSVCFQFFLGSEDYFALTIYFVFLLESPIPLSGPLTNTPTGFFSSMLSSF